MVLHDLQSTVSVCLALRHISVVIPKPGQPFGAFGRSLTFEFGQILFGAFLINDQEQFIRSGRTEKLPRGVERFQSECVAFGGEEIVRSLRETIQQMRTADLLRLAPRIEQAALLKIDAHPFRAHVTHPNPFGQIGDTQPLRAFQFIQNPETRTAADLLEKALFHRLPALK
jgi:hypothetical protein